MRPVAASEQFWELVDREAVGAVIGSGFQFTEGPVWHPRDRYLLFSDIPGDTRHRWDGTTVSDAKRPANKGNGMTYDGDLNLIVCEHATSRLVRERVDGTVEVIASHFEGKELNSPNDVVVKSDGAIYFSDPWYGRMPVSGVERDRELGFQGVYRVAPGGGPPELLVERDEYLQPNGLCFSPDESVLYIDDTDNAHIKAYTVKADGSLGDGRVFVSNMRAADVAGVPDGMKCDELGNIWVTGPGGVHVYDPSGDRIGTIEVDEVVANLAWGGNDWRILFMCASTTVRVITTLVGPTPEPFMQNWA